MATHSVQNNTGCESYCADFPCWEDYQRSQGNYGMISGTILATFIVIANLLLFLGIVFSRNNMRSQRFYQWVLSLSILDVMFGTTLLVVTVISHPGEEGESRDKLSYKMVLFWVNWIGSASFYNFVGLNIERMSAVRWPENYEDQVSFQFNVRFAISKNQVTPKMRGYILISWILAFIPALPFLFDTVGKSDKIHTAGKYH